MKKLSLLIALCMLISIGGVYATWTYVRNSDVADESVNMAMNLTEVAYSGSNGAFKVDTSTLKLSIDPKSGTTHTTSLVIEGEVKIVFTPATFAPADVKQNAVDSTFQFKLSNDNWTFDDGHGDGAKAIVTLAHKEKHGIVWERQSDGTFVYVLDATTLAKHITLNEFVLDTKTRYDSFNTQLANGQIIITVSDGVVPTEGA